MSTVNAVNQTNAAASAEDPAVTPEQIVEELRAVRQRIPEYVQLQASDAKAIQSAANVRPDFAQAAINAIGASPMVLAIVARTPEELQQEVDSAARWSKVEDAG